MQNISLTQLSLLEFCPSCRARFILDKGEYVCAKCGIVKPSFEIQISPRIYEEMEIQNTFVYGGGLGTDIFSKQRGDDGSNSASYDLHGGNGKYEPIVTVMQPWDLLQMVEPDSRIRGIRERYPSRGRKRGINPIRISQMITPILAVARQMRKAEECFFADTNSRESIAVDDPVLYSTNTSRRKRLRLLLKKMRDELPE